MYQGTKYSFALPVELTAKFFGLQYRNRTDDIKITFIVAVGALYSIKICLATSVASYFHSFAQTHTNHQELRQQPCAFSPIWDPRLVCNSLFHVRRLAIAIRLLARSTGIEPVPPRS